MKISGQLGLEFSGRLPISAREIVDEIEDFDLSPDEDFVKPKAKPFFGNFDPEQRKQQFINICQRALDNWGNLRSQLSEPLPDHDQRVIFVRQLYTLAHLFKEQVRLNGDFVFDEHLMGATFNAMNLGAVDDPAVLLATAFHDVVEDILEKDPRFAHYKGDVQKFWRDVLDPQKFLQHLEDENSVTELDRIRTKMVHIVTACTKVRGGSSTRADDKTFRAFLEGWLQDSNSVTAKLADRTHNMATLKHHSDLKRMLIADQTETVYLAVARIRQASEFVRVLVELCMEAINPDIVETYRAETRSRIGRRLGDILEPDLPHGQVKSDASIDFGPGTEKANLIEIRRRLSGIDGISEIKFKVKPLSDYLPPGRFEQMKPKMFQPRNGVLARDDDMFELCVLTDTPDQVASDVLQAFSLHPGSNTTRHNLIASEIVNSGILLSVYDPSIGGNMKIRINDRASEERKKRGIDTDERRRQIKELLDWGDEHDDNGLIDKAREDLLKATMWVHTPDGDVVVVPIDATGLDFAAALGDTSRFVVGAQGMIVTRVRGEAGREFNMFERLKPGRTYWVDSCLTDKNEAFWEAVNVDPGWFEYANTRRARLHLSRWMKYPVARSSDKENKLAGELNNAVIQARRKGAFIDSLAEKYPILLQVVENGRSYCTGIASLFKIEEKDLLRLLIEDYAEKGEGEKEILYRVAVGEISVLKAYANAARYAKSAKFHFLVGHDSGTLTSLTYEFGKRRLSIDGINHAKGVRDAGERVDALVFDFDPREADLHEVFKTILKIRYKGNFEVSALGLPLVRWIPLPQLRAYLADAANQWGYIYSALMFAGFNIGNFSDEDDVRVDSLIEKLEKIEEDLRLKGPSEKYSQEDLNSNLRVVMGLNMKLRSWLSSYVME